MAPALVAVSRRPAILAVELTQGQARRTRAFCAALIKSIPASQGIVPLDVEIGEAALLALSR
jgi:hypothetical protein